MYVCTHACTYVFTFYKDKFLSTFSHHLTHLAVLSILIELIPMVISDTLNTPKRSHMRNEMIR